MSWRSSKYIVLCAVELVVMTGLVVVIKERFGPAAPSTEPPVPVRSTVATEPATHTMLFAGDIMLSRLIGKEITQKKDPLYPFLLIASTTHAADLAFANLESPISTRGTKQGSEYSFRADPATAAGLTYAGFDVLNMANNHVWDYGRDAALDTMALLRDAGISYIGFGRNYDEANAPVIKQVGDTKVAFLGYTQFYSPVLWADERLGLSSLLPDKIVEEIQELKSSGKADLVVISFHWGEEYKTTANEYQRELAHQLIDAGADLIIGHHPHVVQEVEKYDTADFPGNPAHEGWIAYSLGNFIFDQNFSPDTRQGLMLRVIMQGSRIVSVEPVKIEFTKTYQPYVPEE